MNNGSDIFQIKKNFTALTIILLIILVFVDVLLRVSPGTLKPVQRSSMTAVGHHYNFPDGSLYYIYTIFESNGDVYQCWWDEKTWNQKKVTNYKAPTLQ